jgi:hypothetical protein
MCLSAGKANSPNALLIGALNFFSASVHSLSYLQLRMLLPHRVLFIFSSSEISKYAGRASPAFPAM